MVSFAAVVGMSFGFTACEPKEEKKEAYSSDVTKNIDSVTNGFVPDSLKQSSSSLALAGSDPCAGLDFFSCQPNLLKMYMKMTQDVVKLVNDLTPKLDEYIASKEDNTKGSDAIDGAKEAGDLDKIAYNKISATDYKAVMHAKDKGDVILLSVKKEGDKVTYKFDFMMENTKSYEAKQMKRFRGEVVFTDADTYQVDFQMGDVACNSSDVGAPDFLAIAMTRDGDTWKGKSMMRSPRALAATPRTCDTSVSGTTKLYTYTDFVANKDKATSSVYLAKETLSDVADIGDWAAQKYCGNFPCHAGGKLSANGVVVASTYIVPYCADTAASTASWNGACTNLPASGYTAASQWLLPAAMEAKITSLKAYTIPTVTE